MAQKILFATSNQSKLAQFQYVADSVGKYEIVSVYDQYPNTQQYSEDFATQYEIVEHGAKTLFEQVGKPIIVEDTIFNVDALDGRPGLTAAAYLQEHGVEGILTELKDSDKRSARIISIVGSYDGSVLTTFSRTVEGEIAHEKAFLEGEPDWVGPSNHPMGGGFNQILFLPHVGKALAECTAEEGLKLGYREPNFVKILEYLG